MSNEEKAMAKALGDQFIPYIGYDESLRQKIKIPKRKLVNFEADSKKLKKFEELHKKTYLGGKYSFQKVLDLTCAVYSITEEELLSSRRFVRLVRARQQIVYIMRNKRGLSFLELGRRLGDRDHSTIIYSYRSAQDNFAPLKEAYEEILEKLNIGYPEQD